MYYEMVLSFIHICKRKKLRIQMEHNSASQGYTLGLLHLKNRLPHTFSTPLLTKFTTLKKQRQKPGPFRGISLSYFYVVKVYATAKIIFMLSK